MDIITLALSKKYTEDYVDSHSGGTAIMVGTVHAGGSFPTARGDGTALQLGDFVKPTGTLPFTIAGVTFTTPLDRAVFSGGTLWILNANPFQNTSETPAANPAAESVSGTAAIQSAVNAENRTEILARYTKPAGGIPASDLNPAVLAPYRTSAAQDAIDAALVPKSDIRNDLASTDTDKPLSAFQGKVLSENKVAVSDIKDDLASADADKPLSARQGKALKDIADAKVNTADVIDNVTSAVSSKPLSANMGKFLKEYIDSHSGGGGAIFVGTVHAGGSFPTARGDGTALQLGDFVKPTGTLPFTIGTITFTNENDRAVFGGGSTWLLNANPFQNTGDTPVSSPSTESYSGTAAFQAQVNAENRTQIQARYSKPAGGIPRTDMALDVAQSLALADTSVQSATLTSQYRTRAAQDAIDILKVDKVTGKGLSTDDFVASSYYNKVTTDDKISSITAHFRGSFATQAALLAYSGPKSNNDYAYVEVDETHSGQKWRYTYDGSAWAAEYRIDGNASSWGMITGTLNDQLDLKGRLDSLNELKVEKIAGKGLSTDDFVASEHYDKVEVDEKIATATATFRGNFATQAALVSYSGPKSNNDYAVVLADETHTGECWRYKVVGAGATAVWLAEYRINEQSMTAAQIAALDSGVTAAKVAAYDAATTALSGHVANTSNPHSVTKAQVGLGNCDNTSDSNKPVSAATQAALDLKSNISDIKDSLVSTDTDKPLSANQGKALKGIMDRRIIQGSGEPTSATEGAAGTLYVDTASLAIYECAAAAAGATTWKEYRSKSIISVSSFPTTGIQEDILYVCTGGTGDPEYRYYHGGAWCELYATFVGRKDMGEAEGVASLDSTAKVPVSQLPTNIADGVAGLDENAKVLQAQLPMSALTDFFYPVGTVYETADDAFDPNTAWGGTWTRIEDAFIVGKGTTYTATGGSATHSHANPNTGASGTITTNAESGHTHAAGGIYTNLQSRNGALLGFEKKVGDSRTFNYKYTVSSTTESEASGQYGMSCGGTTAGGSSHSHTINSHLHSVGNTGEASNIPPYQAVNIWQRTA